jgi:aryl-alcohol dehydrogenase-like predicted oxidoreductase
MEHVNMGRSGLKVSRACLGAMMFGNQPGAACDEAEGIRIVDAFLDAGGNFIDTANGYSMGHSEEVVGKAVKAKRDKVVVATKGYWPMGDGPNERGLSRLYLTRELDASLRRLDTDYVDIYQCHNWDADTPIEETMDTLAGFVRSGKVRYLGCSNFTGSQIVESCWAAEKVGGMRFVSLQPRYSLITRQIEADVLPACERMGIGTMIYSPLAGGLLTGKYKRGEAPPEGSRFARLAAGGGPARAPRGRGPQLPDDRGFDIADAVGKVAADLGTTPTVVALSWCLQRPGITSVIVGPRTLDQLEQNLAAFDFTLPADTAQRLTELSEPLQ